MKRKRRKREELGDVFYKVLFFRVTKVIKIKSEKNLPSYGLKSSEKRLLGCMRKEFDPTVDRLQKSLSEFPKSLAPKRVIFDDVR